MPYNELFNNKQYEVLLNLTTEQLQDGSRRHNMNELLIWNVKALVELERYQEIIKFVENVKFPNKDSIQWVQYMYEVSEAYYMVGNRDSKKSMIQNLNSALTIAEKFHQRSEIIRIHGQLARFHLLDVNSQDALHHINKGLALAKDEGDWKSVGINLKNLGIYYHNAGDYNKALSYYLEALNILETSPSSENSFKVLLNIGMIYIRKGLLDNAVDCLERALNIASKRNAISGKRRILEELGNVYLEMNKIDLAIKIFMESIEVSKLIGPSYVAVSYLRMVDVYLITGEYQLATEYFNRFENYYNEDINLDSNIQQIYYLLYKAKILYCSQKIEDKIKARTIFREVIASPVSVSEMRITSYFYIIESLIDEYKLYGNIDIFNDIQTQLSTLYDEITDNQLYPAIIDTFILRAKLDVVVGNYDNALQYIDEALTIANKQDLTSKVVLVENEKEQILNSIRELRNLLSKSDIGARIEKLEIEQYIKKAKERIHR